MHQETAKTASNSSANVRPPHAGKTLDLYTSKALPQSPEATIQSRCDAPQSAVFPSAITLSDSKLSSSSTVADPSSVHDALMQHQLVSVSQPAASVSSPTGSKQSDYAEAIGRYQAAELVQAAKHGMNHAQAADRLLNKLQQTTIELVKAQQQCTAAERQQQLAKAAASTAAFTKARLQVRSCTFCETNKGLQQLIACFRVSMSEAVHG